MNSNSMVEDGMVGMVCTELLSEKFENESEGGKTGTQGRHLGLSRNGLR
jgi:hypothetical protein